MRDYLLYPKAIEKIERSGIKARVEELEKSEDGLPDINGFVYGGDIIRSTQYLQEQGYYNHLPSDFAVPYRRMMNEMVNTPENFGWKIQRHSGEIIEPCELEDLLLFSGDLASMVLKPEEIWDYARFGFSSASEFVTTVGAFVKEQSNRMDSFKNGYKWTRKRDDGSEIVTEVTGDGNADLRIYQTDIAAYPTHNPFGNPIEMRPEMKADRLAVAAYHSTEATLFIAVMKYIEQQDIAADYRKDDATKLIEWGRSLGQGGGTCAEHFGGFESNLGSFLREDDAQIPILDEANRTEQISNFLLPTQSGGAYGVYVAHNGDLVLSYQKENYIQNPVKPISARFLPEDAEHLVRGLIYQSAKGLGRTSASQLLELLEFRFSEGMK